MKTKIKNRTSHLRVRRAPPVVLRCSGKRGSGPISATFVDPVEGGSANDYDYAGADAVNLVDLDGRFVVILGAVLLAAVLISMVGAPLMIIASEVRRMRRAHAAARRAGQQRQAALKFIGPPAPPHLRRKLVAPVASPPSPGLDLLARNSVPYWTWAGPGGYRSGAPGPTVRAFRCRF